MSLSHTKSALAVLGRENLRSTLPDFSLHMFEVHTFSATAYTTFGDAGISRQRGHDWKDVDNFVLVFADIASVLLDFLGSGTGELVVDPLRDCNDR
jgi:hypothetical protein